METADFGRRYPTPAEILAEVERGLPIALGIPGEPRCQIRVFPNEREVHVLVEDDVSRPNVHNLRNLRSGSTEADGHQWAFVSMTWTHSLLESYLFACTVVDRVQHARESLASAIDVALSGLRELLRRDGRLSREAEVGLFGELIVLACLARTMEPDRALDAWLGILHEEHDFALAEFDLEVKTTSSEERSHWISSGTQLQAVANRELRLVSLQVTPKGDEHSISMPRLVDHLISAFPGRMADLSRKLEAAGYFREDASLYPTTWALRTPILEFIVGEDFPKITSVELSVLGEPVQDITDIRYRIRLEGRESSDPRVQYVADLSEFQV